MRKRNFKMIAVAVMAAVGVAGGIMNVNAASQTKNTYIDSEHGYLTGTTDGMMALDEKLFCTSAKTKSNVSRIRATLGVEYYSTGEAIGDGETTGWIYNTNSAITANYEMHHFRNKLNNNKYDGFVNTKCAAYGTADAINGDPYVVHTKIVY